MRFAAATLVVLSLARCDGFVGEVSFKKPVFGAPVAIVNPDYVVLRPVTKTPTAGAASGVVYGQTLYFQPSDRILDLTHLDPRTAEIEVSSSGSGSHAVFISTTPDGGRALHQWTSAHVGQQLGVFLDGRLIAAPFINTPISDMIVLDVEFTKAEAEVVLARLRAGGA